MGVSKILVIDDDPIQGKIIQHILGDLDYEIKILKSDNGLDALKIVEGEQPDLILTDWDMPKMTGIDFCKRIQQNKHFKDIPVIMCTGINTSSENLKTAFESGVVDFIRKLV